MQILGKWETLSWGTVEFDQICFFFMIKGRLTKKSYCTNEYCLSGLGNQISQSALSGDLIYSVDVHLMC